MKTEEMAQLVYMNKVLRSCKTPVHFKAFYFWVLRKYKKAKASGEFGSSLMGLLDDCRDLWFEAVKN